MAVKNVVKSLGFLHPLSTNDLRTFLPLVEPQFVNFQDFRGQSRTPQIERTEKRKKQGAKRGRMSKVPGVTSFDGIPPDGATCSNDGQTGTVAGRVPSRGGDLCRSMPAPHHSTTPFHPSLHAPATSLSLKYLGYYHVR